jgi:predicted RNA-binding Zn-ribbon protein involved in translation (DUF1610 family)
VASGWVDRDTILGLKKSWTGKRREFMFLWPGNGTEWWLLCEPKKRRLKSVHPGELPENQTFLETNTVLREYSKSEAVRWFDSLGFDIPAYLSDYATADPEYLSVGQVIAKYQVDRSTVTRWCVDKGKKQRGCKLESGEWKIPTTAERHFKWPKRPSSGKKRPSLKDAVVWECVSCNYEISSKTKPVKCSKCGGSTFTRQTHRNPAT